MARVQLQGEGASQVHAWVTRPRPTLAPLRRREAAAAVRSRCRLGLDVAAASVFLAQPLAAALLPGGYRLPDVVLRAAALVGRLTRSQVCTSSSWNWPSCIAARVAPWREQAWAWRCL